jgi:pyrroline-5-carboxylate reductase
MSSQGYTLAVVGCGTMGVAVMSGVLDSKKASEAKRAASAALSSSSSSSANGINNDLSASIASLLEVDDEDEHQDGAEGGSTSSRSMQLPDHFLACVSRSESAKRLKKTFQEYSSQVEVYAGDNLNAVKRADVILLACKPQMVKDVLQQEGMKDALRGKLVCSICAGLKIKSIQQWLHEDSTVVRAMPNTPAKVSISPLLSFSFCGISHTHDLAPCVPLYFCTDSRGHDHPHSSSSQ